MTGEKGDEIERNAPSRWPRKSQSCVLGIETPRGDRVSSFPFVSFRVCFRLFSDIPRERIKIETGWRIFFGRISRKKRGGDSKINRRRRRYGLTLRTTDCNEPRRVFSSRFLGDRGAFKGRIN